MTWVNHRLSREIPILFSGSMVRAILDGKKTVTRRVFKGDAEWLAGAGDNCDDPENWGAYDEHGSVVVLDQSKPPYPGNGNGRPHEVFRWTAPWQVGDRLWVRETWAHDADSIESCKERFESMSPGPGYGPYYRATEVSPDTLHWRPSIHMPKWACRLWLEVVSVEIERLQSITRADIVNEGWPCSDEQRAYADIVRSGAVDDGIIDDASIEWFCELWDSLNAKRGYGWDDNPWVWRIEFRKAGAK